MTETRTHATYGNTLVTFSPAQIVVGNRFRTIKPRTARVLILLMTGNTVSAHVLANVIGTKAQYPEKELTNIIGNIRGILYDLGSDFLINRSSVYAAHLPRRRSAA